MEKVRYIVKKRMREAGISGRVNLPYGTEVEAVDGLIIHQGAAVCAVTSRNAHLYFARDDDGQGRERGALTAAFTTVPGSAIEAAVDCPIYYYDDPEDPYPLLLSIFPEVYQLTYALLDLLNGTDRLPVMETAMEELETVCKRAVAQFAPQAREFARKHRTEPGIYTVSAGLDRCVAYILTNCSFMESVWRHSSPLHAGELFHGACEAIGRETPVVAFLGLGRYRPVEERAVKFLQRITDKLTVLDAAALDLTGIPEELRDVTAPLVLHAVASDFCLQLSYLTGHPMSSRRYMGVMKY